MVVSVRLNLSMSATPRLEFAALVIVAFSTTSYFPSYPSVAQMSAPDLNPPPVGGSASPDIPKTRTSNEYNPSLINRTPNDSRDVNHPGTSIRPVWPYVTPIDYK